MANFKVEEVPLDNVSLLRGPPEMLRQLAEKQNSRRVAGTILCKLAPPKKSAATPAPAAAATPPSQYEAVLWLLKDHKEMFGIFFCDRYVQRWTSFGDLPDEQLVDFCCTWVAVHCESPTPQ
jgi:hypothetical protein